MANSGFVYLVGAGPGDARLLTVRAYELLRSAQVVAHDELVTPSILALIPKEAECLAVGRRQGQGRARHRIHPAVLERARAGQSVVRLKCGDPFIYGRGGEEAQALSEAGIGFEIVPGISAALGAAAYAGIPLTHRQKSSNITFLTGHNAEETPCDGQETAVIYMASKRLAANAKRLLARGFSPSTQAAYISWATTPQQQVRLMPLGRLAEFSDEAAKATAAPALLIVGHVVDLHRHLRWFERQPLRGRRLLVARARPGPSALAAKLRRLGAEVLEAPHCEVAPLADEAALHAALAVAPRYDAVAFACAASVEMLLRHGAMLRQLRTMAIGKQAAAALRRCGALPVLSTPGACAQALAESAGQLHNRRLLLFVSTRGRPKLLQALSDLGATTEAVPAYHLLQRMPCQPLPPVDALLLPSSSAAQAVFASGLAQDAQPPLVLAMGPHAEARARRYGAPRILVAEEDTVPSLITAAVNALGTP